MVDADKQPGGLAGSFKTPEGSRFEIVHQSSADRTVRTSSVSAIHFLHAGHDFEPWEGFRFDHGYMIIPTRYEFIKKLLEELGPGDEKKTKEFIEFVQKTRNNFVYIRNGFILILYGHSKKCQWVIYVDGESEPPKS